MHLRQIRIVSLAIVTLIFAAAAAAAAEGTPVISDIFPRSFVANSGEHFITIEGTNLLGTYFSHALMSGPAGQFDVQVSSMSPAGFPPDRLVCWVPLEILARPGHYSLVVRTITERWGTLDSEPAYFDVVGATPFGYPPRVHVPTEVRAEATGPDGAIVMFEVSATSDADGAIAASCDHDSGARFPLGRTVVTCNAADVFGRVYASFTVIVEDTTGPAVHVPDDFTVASGTVVKFEATAYDVVDGARPVTCTPASETTFPIGRTMVTCVAEDRQGIPGSGTFYVTVVDSRPPDPPPTLTLPGDITLEATAADGAEATFTVATSAGTVACVPASGSTFALGTTEVHCTATADSGTASGVFHVSVTDTTPPSLTLPDSVTSIATSANGAEVTFDTSATDVVDGAVAVACTPASGTLFPAGTTTVACTAVDAHGNTASGTFPVSVSSSAPPDIASVHATPSMLWPPDHRMVPVTVDVVATAFDGTPLLAHIVSVTSSEPDDATGDGDQARDIRQTSALSVELRAERSGRGGGRRYTIVVEAIDDDGNTAFGVTTVFCPKTVFMATSH